MLTTEDQDLLLYIGKQLAKLRKERKLSLRALAEKMNTSNTWLSKIELGKKDVQVTTLARLAKALDVDITYFLP
jgi:transcriptional regulator with XRE-family HTH domain